MSDNSEIKVVQWVHKSTYFKQYVLKSNMLGFNYYQIIKDDGRVIKNPMIFEHCECIEVDENTNIALLSPIEWILSQLKLAYKYKVSSDYYDPLIFALKEEFYKTSLKNNKNLYT